MNNNKNKENDNKNEIFDLSGYKENVCKSISNSDNQNSSKEIDSLLNIISSNENHNKPQVMEINYKQSSFK